MIGLSLASVDALVSKGYGISTYCFLFRCAYDGRLLPIVEACRYDFVLI